MKKNAVRAYAQANGLNVVTLTDGISVLVGFNDFAAVEAAAKALGRDWTDIQHISKQDGQECYEYDGTAFEEYTVTADMYGMEYEMYEAEDADNYLANQLDTANEVREYEDDEDSAHAIEVAARVNAEKIRALERGYAIVMCCGDIVDTVKVRTMEIHIDCECSYIGLNCGHLTDMRRVSWDYYDEHYRELVAEYDLDFALDMENTADMCIERYGKDMALGVLEEGGNQIAAWLPDGMYVYLGCTKKEVINSLRIEYSTVGLLVGCYADEVADVEIYRSTQPSQYYRGIYTDSISMCEDDNMVNDCNVLDFAIMDEAEYDATVLANSCIRADFDKWYGDKDARVLVIVVDEEDELDV